MRTRTYTELSRLTTFQDRFDYLKLEGHVGEVTFGFGRYINQTFYASREWKQARQGVIIRDNGCDLGVFGYEIHVDMLIHHINPITPENIIEHEEWILDPEYLILTTKTTHNAIHYGDFSLLPEVVVERSAGDTRLW